MSETKIELPSKVLPHIISSLGPFSFDIYDREDSQIYKLANFILPSFSFFF